ncbi:sigma-70 family RNA polymerase sigma factor [Qipengyuania sp. YG27]|uniref:Sigma-70 family RNA polymerase sigma factor n=1 Tax=Qipengyuania mesophila TaxID=2867246 RepID=A0ABS7JWU4_9SPHN|nr:sigma-70 family RNA polymerase sigma factor [Qipengyuania mesophila]MBX7502121.1 sigma-70 family RNA polymerase sigma factor [Qipengyuania mesophila]
MNPASVDARNRLIAAMRRLAQGERAALEEVYRATSAKLFGICYRILGDEKEAEDALQDVYLTLWRRADRYDPRRASPIAWLATFARNRAIDRLRTGKVRRGTVAEDEATQLADEAPLADAILIDAEREARVHTCLQSLDDAPRVAIRTAFFEGRTYTELAESMEVPLGTMKSWIRRGLAKLKTCMEAGE